MLTAFKTRNSKLETRSGDNFRVSNFELRVLENPSVDDLKQELAQGNVIVAPFEIVKVKQWNGEKTSPTTKGPFSTG